MSARFTLGLAVAASVLPLVAPAQAQLIERKDMSYPMALAIAQGALDDCKARGYPVSVVVVGSGQSVSIPAGDIVEADLSDAYGLAPGQLAVTKTIAGPLAGEQGAIAIRTVCNGTALTPDFVIAARTPASTLSHVYSNVPAPASCVPCHEGERPTSTEGWKSTTHLSAPFDYATHGAGLDCATCHAGPGTGAWGGTQNWVGGLFAHGAGTPAASTCVACHSSQRPDLNGVQPSQLAGFDHSAHGAIDCFVCHQATVSRGSYTRYLPIPGDDWAGGVGAPDGASDPAQSIIVAAEIPTVRVRSMPA